MIVYVGEYVGENSYRLLVNSKFEGMYVDGTEEGENNLLEINSSWKIGIYVSSCRIRCLREKVVCV